MGGALTMTDYGPAPDEPAALVSGETTRVQIRMPNGKRSVRKLYIVNTVKELFSAVQGLLLSDEDTKAQAQSGFDLKMGFPPKSLAVDMDQTVEGAGLANQSISVVAMQSSSQ